MPTTQITHDRVTWTNIVNPTAQDIASLSRDHPSFHPLNLQDCLTELEFPKLDHHDEYVFLILQFPYWDASARISRPEEVDIFISRGNLVTSHRGELKPLNELFAQFQADEAARHDMMSGGASPLLYHLLSRLIDYCFPILHVVSRQLSKLEDELFNHETRALLQELALVRRDIIALKRILNPQLEVITALEQGNWPFIHEELDIYWGDLNDHLAQLNAMLAEYAEVISGLSDTVDALASHRIDEVVRLLTLVTVITLPVTVISTIFSMNVALPYERHPLMFYGVLAIAVIIAIWITYFLRRKNWF